MRPVRERMKKEVRKRIEISSTQIALSKKN